MSWLSLLLALIKLLSLFTNYAREKKLITAGEAAFIADALREQAADVEIGKAARNAQRERDAGGVPDDEHDPFRRD